MQENQMGKIVYLKHEDGRMCERSEASAQAVIDLGFTEITKREYEAETEKLKHNAGMTVGQLIKALKKYPKKYRVITQGEHGDPTPLDCAEETLYRPEEVWCGDIVYEEDADGDEEKVIMLWGIN